MDAKALPKIELHVHLDISLSFAVARAIDPTITLQQFRRDFVAPSKCTSLLEFLAKTPKSISLMQSEQNLRMVVEDLFSQFDRDGVIYAEIRFAPLLHTEQGLTPEQVVAIIESETANASQKTGIDVGIILCTLRHFTNEQSMHTAELVDAFRGTHVVALDLAGDEVGFPISPHVEAFRYAEAHGLGRTAHAGEAAGAASVWESLDHLHPNRIGHGVRSIEDDLLIAYLRQKHIHLEVCPTSNVQTDAFATYADHPIAQLFERGVSVGINTDARTITNITLTREYRKLQQTFGWGAAELLQCNLGALDAAFASETVQERVRGRLLSGYNSVTSTT